MSVGMYIDLLCVNGTGGIFRILFFLAAKQDRSLRAALFLLHSLLLYSFLLYSFLGVFIFRPSDQPWPSVLSVTASTSPLAASISTQNSSV